MKKVLLTVVAATAMATALPALAQPYGNAYGHPSNRGHDSRGYDDRNWVPMQARIQRLDERIDRGIANGAITRGEARRLRMQLFQLVRMENDFRRDGLNRWERQELDRRFEQLRMQIRYERRDDDRRWDGDRRDDRRRY
ncbi:MAG TPA: hypothetical protein VF699_08770 [Caulobacteraceae bacterium]